MLKRKWPQKILYGNQVTDLSELPEHPTDFPDFDENNCPQPRYLKSRSHWLFRLFIMFADGYQSNTGEAEAGRP